MLRVPGLGSALTLQFGSRSSTTWALIERTSVLDFEQELSMATEPWEQVERHGRRYAYTAKSWQGEPVERHLTASRQTLWWEQAGVMLELQRVNRHSPSWRRLWRAVDSLR